MGQQIDYAALAAKFGGTSQTAGSAAPMGGRSVLAQGRTSMGDLSEAPDEGLIGRLMSALEPMAHPQSWSDFGHLVVGGAVPMTIGPTPAVSAPQGLSVPIRKPIGSALERMGRSLQHPTQAPGDFVEWMGRKVKGAAPSVTPSTPSTPPSVPSVTSARTPRPGSFEEYMTASPERQAAIVKARQEYLVRGGRQSTSKAAAPARGSAPAATVPAAPSTPAPMSVPVPGPALQLTPEEQAAFDQLIQAGHDPADILRGIQEYRQSAPAPPPTPAATSVPMPSGSLPRGIQTTAELKEFDRLLAAGKSHGEALQMIQQLRTLQSAHGLPTTEDALRSVADRNATGRWRE